MSKNKNNKPMIQNTKSRDCPSGFQFNVGMDDLVRYFVLVPHIYDIEIANGNRVLFFYALDIVMIFLRNRSDKLETKYFPEVEIMCIVFLPKIKRSITVSLFIKELSKVSMD